MNLAPCAGACCLHASTRHTERLATYSIQQRTGSQVQRRVVCIVPRIHGAPRRHEGRQHVRLTKRRAIVQCCGSILGAAGHRDLQGIARSRIEQVCRLEARRSRLHVTQACRRQPGVQTRMCRCRRRSSSIGGRSSWQRQQQAAAAAAAMAAGVDRTFGQTRRRDRMSPRPDRAAMCSGVSRERAARVASTSAPSSTSMQMDSRLAGPCNKRCR